MALRWAEFKKLPEAQAVTAISLFERDGAKQWFTTITRPNSIEQLEEVFRRRYVIKSTHAGLWKDLVEAYDMTQQTGQSVDDFITLIEKKAQKG